MAKADKPGVSTKASPSQWVEEEIFVFWTVMVQECERLALEKRSPPEDDDGDAVAFVPPTITGIPAAQQCLLYMRMLKALFPTFDAEAAEIMARGDFEKDVLRDVALGSNEHPLELSQRGFMEALRELADVWSDDDAATRYVEFLRTILARVTVPNFRWEARLPPTAHHAAKRRKQRRSARARAAVARGDSEREQRPSAIASVLHQMRLGATTDSLHSSADFDSDPSSSDSDNEGGGGGSVEDEDERMLRESELGWKDLPTFVQYTLEGAHFRHEKQCFVPADRAEMASFTTSSIKERRPRLLSEISSAHQDLVRQLLGAVAEEDEDEDAGGEKREGEVDATESPTHRLKRKRRLSRKLNEPTLSRAELIGLAASGKLIARMNEDVRNRIASELHEEWREGQRLSAPAKRARDGELVLFQPRWKEVEGGELVDIANLAFDDLPLAYQSANQIAGDIAFKFVEEGYDRGISVTSVEFLEAGGSNQHDHWLKANPWCTDPLQTCVYEELTEMEKEKDRAIVRTAIHEMTTTYSHFYTPEARVARAAVMGEGTANRLLIGSRASDDNNISDKGEHTDLWDANLDPLHFMPTIPPTSRVDGGEEGGSADDAESFRRPPELFGMTRLSLPRVTLQLRRTFQPTIVHGVGRDYRWRLRTFDEIGFDNRLILMMAAVAGEESHAAGGEDVHGLIDLRADRGVRPGSAGSENLSGLMPPTVASSPRAPRDRGSRSNSLTWHGSTDDLAQQNATVDSALTSLAADFYQPGQVTPASPTSPLSPKSSSSQGRPSLSEIMGTHPPTASSLGASIDDSSCDDLNVSLDEDELKRANGGEGGGGGVSGGGEDEEVNDVNSPPAAISPDAKKAIINALIGARGMMSKVRATEARFRSSSPLRKPSLFMSRAASPIDEVQPDGDEHRPTLDFDAGIEVTIKTREEVGGGALENPATTRNNMSKTAPALARFYASSHVDGNYFGQTSRGAMSNRFDVDDGGYEKESGGAHCALPLRRSEYIAPLSNSLRTDASYAIGRRKAARLLRSGVRRANVPGTRFSESPSPSLLRSKQRRVKRRAVRSSSSSSSLSSSSPVRYYVWISYGIFTYFYVISLFVC